MTKIVLVKPRRGHVMKRTIQNRLSPEFVEDLALNEPYVREGVYRQIKDPLYLRRLRAAVDAKVEELEAHASERGL